jgi:hypothetical protein
MNMKGNAVTGLRVKSAVKSAGWNSNHNAGLRVKSAVKGAGWNSNHNVALVSAR